MRESKGVGLKVTQNTLNTRMKAKLLIRVILLFQMEKTFSGTLYGQKKWQGKNKSQPLKQPFLMELRIFWQSYTVGNRFAIFKAIFENLLHKIWYFYYCKFAAAPEARAPHFSTEFGVSSSSNEQRP
jgi:hypothetical protein